MRPTFAFGEQQLLRVNSNSVWYSVPARATVFSACSLVCWLPDAQRDVCSGLLSGAQHDVLQRTQRDVWVGRYLFCRAR
jgi:hypothetical protein